MSKNKMNLFKIFMTLYLLNTWDSLMSLVEAPDFLYQCSGKHDGKLRRKNNNNNNEVCSGADLRLGNGMNK